VLCNLEAPEAGQVIRVAPHDSRVAPPPQLLGGKSCFCLLLRLLYIRCSDLHVSRRLSFSIKCSELVTTAFSGRLAESEMTARAWSHTSSPISMSQNSPTIIVGRPFDAEGRVVCTRCYGPTIKLVVKKFDSPNVGKCVTAAVVCAGAPVTDALCLQNVLQV